MNKKNQRAKVKFRVFGAQPKFAKLAKKQKDITHNKEMHQPVKTYSELTQMLEIAHRTLKQIKTIFYMLKS